MTTPGFQADRHNQDGRDNPAVAQCGEAEEKNVHGGMMKPVYQPKKGCVE